MSARDPFADLERHRSLLEENVSKLSDALDEWRQWKLEYELLRKEVRGLSPEAPREALARVRQGFRRGGLVDSKALADIFGPDDARRPEQVVGVLTNRIDYVGRNVDTLARQLQAAENKLAAVNVVSNPEATDEDGLPITEIMEQLDDDDNVVSYDLGTAGSKQAQLSAMMQKAGVEAPPANGTAASPAGERVVDVTDEPQGGKPPPEGKAAEAEPETAVKQKPASTLNPKAPTKPRKKKGVTFTDDTKSGEDQDALRERAKKAQEVEELMRQAKEQEELHVVAKPIVPVDESEEDKQLRRDMLEYGLAAPAPVVAELQLVDGPFSDDGFGTEDDSNFDDDDDDDSDDEEDQWGRSTRRFVDDEYRQKMAEIQDRLAKQVFGRADAVENPFSANEATGEVDSDEEAKMNGLAKISIKQDKSTPSSNQLNPTAEHPDGKKSVRFAPALDIAGEAAPPVPDATSAVPPSRPEADPLSDIVERTDRQGPSPAVAAPAPKKSSRFKAERLTGQTSRAFDGPVVGGGGTPILPERPSADRPVAPSGPEGKIVAPSVVEREGLAARTTQEAAPDALDADLLHQEVAVEYHKMRNRMIQRQGGFMKEDEAPVQPLDEDEGGPRRVSRFRAARLARP